MMIIVLLVTYLLSNHEIKKLCFETARGWIRKNKNFTFASFIAFSRCGRIECFVCLPKWDLNKLLKRETPCRTEYKKKRLNNEKCSYWRKFEIYWNWKRDERSCASFNDFIPLRTVLKTEIKYRSERHSSRNQWVVK